MQLDIEYLMENLSLEEKAGLCSGEGSWWTKSVERLGLKAIMVSDGPNGLRQQPRKRDSLEGSKSVEAVCFPTGSCAASSFDKNLFSELGDNLGKAARARRLHTILGPAINIKRSPLCGRNFEYLSEDPYLSGKLASSYIKGVQANGVGVSLKHFAANNQEYCRMSVDSIISERALREIYYCGFEMAVKEAHPWAMMCSYNKINGVFSSENGWLMSHILRKEWGFDGIVMTDWGAMNDRIKALKAGVELEMPSSGGKRDEVLVEAVETGKLRKRDLDEHVRRILCWIAKGIESDDEYESYDLDAQHEASVRMATESAVLLKNSFDVLPISPKAKVAFLGTYAANPRFQGGGSSHLVPYKLRSPLQCAPEGTAYAELWNEDGETTTPALEEEGIRLASSCDVAVIFAALPDSYESEGFDRSSLQLPEIQEELIEKVANVARSTIVVLQNGSPITMRWLDKVDGVLEMYLAGEAVGEAAVALLYGDANPCGHLAETFPMRIEDTPCFGFFPGDGKRSVYAEDIYVGYRWYDTRKMDVLFPFGYGLSYTSFSIESIKACAKDDGVLVTASVKNTGKKDGKAVIQAYVYPPQGHVNRPSHELKGFEKVMLKAGEAGDVSFFLDRRAFSYYETRIEDWHVESGIYTIGLGMDSRNVEQAVSINIKSSALPIEADDSLTIGEVIDAGFKDALELYDEQLFESFGVYDSSRSRHVLKGTAARRMCLELPVHSLPSFTDAPSDIAQRVIEKIKQ